MKGDIKALELKSVTATLAIKCYDEQLQNGEDALTEAITSTAKELFQVIAIKHDKSDAKPHWHIIIRAAERSKKFQVSSMLKKLGVCFDAADDNIMQHRSIETVGDFVSYTTYLLHQTIDAKRAGKAEYSIEDMISNLQFEEIQQILNGYSIKKKALKPSDLNICIDRAREAGYKLQEYYEFLDSLNISGLKEKEEAQIKKSYEAGIRRLKDENIVIARTFVNLICKDTRSALETVRNVFADKKQLLLIRDMQYNCDVNSEVLISTWDIEKLVANKQLLFGDGIVEGNAKNADVVGFWLGSYVIIISSLGIARGIVNRCNVSKKFFTVEMIENDIVEIQSPTVYLDDEWEEIKKLYDLFIEKLKDEVNNKN